VLLNQGTTDLLRENLAGDARIPSDEVLINLGRAVAGSQDPDAWRSSVRKLLLAQADRERLVEHLAGIQFLGSVGAPTGARLLAGFWQQADLDVWAEALGATRDLETLAEIAAGRGAAPLELAPLAGGVHRTLSLAAQMKQAGLRRAGMDLLTAVVLVQANHGHGQVVLMVGDALAQDITRLIARPGPWPSGFAGSLDGISLFGGLLVIDLGEPEAAPDYPDGFPTLLPGAPTEAATGDAAAPAPAPVEDAVVAEDEEEQDEGAIDNSRLKKLVLDNIMSTSVLLEFLRDAKVTSIPGLVEEVVNRTRNPQILETVITDRRLHTGFANKGVPLACLRSPVNVSIKSLRKFIHVKYISKVDLKRMANDRTGVRKDVGREIERYLKSLA
jgi:hypothetical protein